MTKTLNKCFLIVAKTNQLNVSIESKCNKYLVKQANTVEEESILCECNLQIHNPTATVDV